MPRVEKKHLTTGDAARLCGLSQQTIIRAFDDCKLRGFRIPGSKFRRIPKVALYEFMRDHGIPVDATNPLWGGETFGEAGAEPGPAPAA